MPEVSTEALQDAIRNLHGCESVFASSVEVTKTYMDSVVWQGDVQVFDLISCPDAPRAYVWSYPTGEDEDGPRRFVVVLHRDFVDSPSNAVDAAILSGQA